MKRRARLAGARVDGGAKTPPVAPPSPKAAPLSAPHLAAANKRDIARFVAAFLGGIGLLAAVQASGLEAPIANAMGAWTAAVATRLLELYEPAFHAWGNLIGGPRSALLVGEACSGLELMVLLAAAILAYPARWRHRLLGIALVAPFVFLMNVVRVATLSLAIQYDPLIFDALHSFVWQGVLLLGGLAYWLLWSASEPLAS